MGLGFSLEGITDKGTMEKEETFEQKKANRNKHQAGVILGMILLLVIIYAVSQTVEYISLIFAFIFSILTVITNPNVIKQLTEVPVLTYYSIFLSITLFFSIDDYKNNSTMMMLLVSNILVCVAVFLSATPFVCYLFIFTNFYVVIRIFAFFASSPEKDLTTQYGKHLLEKNKSVLIASGGSVGNS